MNRKWKIGLSLVMAFGVMMSNVVVYGFTEIPNEELDVIVQEENQVPSVTPTPSKDQYEYDTEKYEPKEEIDKNQSGNSQNANNSNMNHQSVNNQNVNNHNVNGSSANNPSGNNQNTNSPNGSKQNTNSPNGSNQNANRQSVSNQNTNNHNANTQNKNNRQENIQQNNTKQETTKPILQPQFPQAPLSQETTIIIEETTTEIIGETVGLQENAPLQETPAQHENSVNQQKQVILNKIADIDTLLETFAREDVLSKNLRSELYDNSNYVIMSKNGEFLSITAVIIVLFILLAMKLH